MTHIISKFNQGNKKSDMIAITNYSHGVCPHGRTPYRGISVVEQPAINLSTFFHQFTRSTCSTRLKLLVENRSDLISTVWKTPYHAMPPWTNTLPRHFRRGPASHKLFNFLSSISLLYIAKTFSVHRRVHNHYTKRTLNLILNRKKSLRRENDALGKQNCVVF